MVAPAVTPAARQASARSDQLAADVKLRAEVGKACRALEELVRHRELLGAGVMVAITDTVAEVRRRLASSELALVVVGEKKAGKSTLLNAILGERVLGAAVRECTATVTFIRRAPRPTYRALLRDGKIVVFDDLELAERVALNREIEALQLPRDAEQRPAWRCGRCDPDAALAVAMRQHAEVGRRRARAQAAHQECEHDHARSTADLQEVVAARDAAQALATRLAQQLAARRQQLVKHEAQLAARTNELRQLAPRQARTLAAAADAGARAAAEQALQTADAQLASATAAVPFFLRPAPWWALWMLGLRLLLGWLFQGRVQQLAGARRDHQIAQLVAATCNAAGHVDQLTRDVAVAGAPLRAAQDGVASEQGRVQTAEAQQHAAAQQVHRSRAALAECWRDEARARLFVIHARLDALDTATLARFRTEVHSLTDMNKQGQDVAELAIGFPATHLPDGITIIDTPGVNTDNALNRERAWSVIRRDGDGCLLVSDLQQVVSDSTREFLHEVRAIIPHILLVISKVDRALDNADGIGGTDPWQQVEEARRAGVRRFAREVGRAPEEVFSIAVAAEPALRGDLSAAGVERHFTAEIAKLFGLLQAERAIVLGARAASALRDCVKRIDDAQAQAEASYKQRIAELERQRVPEPKEFQARQLAKIEDTLQRYADETTRATRDALAKEIDAVRRQWITRIQGCRTKQDVRTAVSELGLRSQATLGGVMSKVQHAGATRSSAALQALEAPLLEELRERYRIVQRMTGSALTMQIGGADQLNATVHAANLSAGIAQAVKSFEADQLKLGAGGALAGAALGTLVFPGLGTAIGAALGACAQFFKTLDSLKGDCVGQVDSGLDAAKDNLDRQLASWPPLLQRQMRSVLAGGLADAVARFQSWIDQIMAAERKLIDHEREKLSHLVQSRETLLQHDKTLAALHGEVAATSRGLCGMASATAAGSPGVIDRRAL